MRPPAVLPFLFVIAAAPACACPELTGDQAAEQVRLAFAEWNDAVVHKDLAKTMAIFSQSIHFQFQGSPDFGYARLLSIYTSSFSRENAPQWQPAVENIIGSPELVTLFGEWKLMPAGGGDPLSQYRGVDVFQREADCEWRVTASLNYADKSVLALIPPGHTVGPAEASAGRSRPLVAARDAAGAVASGPR